MTRGARRNQCRRLVFARPRDDDLIDDRPALADLGETDPDYVTRCSWRVGIRHRLYLGGL